MSALHRHGVEVVQAADGVWYVGTRDVNWAVLADPDGAREVTLVDAGYPGNADDVCESLRRIGRSWDDVVAVVATHGHIDHVGGLPTLLASRAVPVYAAADELPNLHLTRRESAGVTDVVRNAWRPRVVPWALRIAKLGATHEGGTAALPFDSTTDGALDLPGRPRPVPTPGHTSGHTAFFVPTAGAVLTGDTLCTAHPTSSVVGPQLLLPMFDHDRPRVVRALDTLAGLNADVIVPGHGPLLRSPIATAAAVARDRADRSRGRGRSRRPRRSAPPF